MSLLKRHKDVFAITFGIYRLSVRTATMTYNRRIIPIKERIIPTKRRPLIVFDGDPRQEEHLAIISGYWRPWKFGSIKTEERKKARARSLEAERLKVKFSPPTLVLRDGSHLTRDQQQQNNVDVTQCREAQFGDSAAGSGNLLTTQTRAAAVKPEPPILLSNKKNMQKIRQTNVHIYQQLEGDPRLRDFTMDDVDGMLRCQQEGEADQHIVDIPNPYEKEKTKCILCANNIIPHYKNPKLLSQFVSPVTGHVFTQSVAGLCKWQYDRLIAQIKMARYLLLMPTKCRSKEYMRDPELCDPMHPKYKIFG